MTPARRNQRVVVIKRAAGIPAAENFRLETVEMPSCPAGGVLVQVLLAAVDPAMRGWLSTEQNYQSVPTGAVMWAAGVARILASDLPQWRVGDHVYGEFGWQQFCAAMPTELQGRVDLSLAPAEKWLSVLGLNGLTAWIGLHRFVRPQAGETILVGTAAGSVGSLMGQLARACGMRTVGLTSSDDKCALALAQYGYDAMINYRAEPDLNVALSTACPAGIDVYFDTVGGSMADTVFTHLKQRARIVQCGTASIDSWIPIPSGPRRERVMLVKRLTWQGFVITDHVDEFAEAQQQLAARWQQGALTSHEQILDGLDQAPSSIGMLYESRNEGRLLIRP